VVLKNRLPTKKWAKLGKPKKMLNHPEVSSKGKAVALPNTEGAMGGKSVTRVSGKLKSCRRNCQA